MTPGTYNLTIVQGSNLVRTFTFTNTDGSALDLLNYEVRMAGRESITDTNVLFEWSSEDDTPYLVIDIGIGVISLSVPASITSAFSFSSGIWDMELYKANDTEVQRVIEGDLYLSPEVTR